MKGESPLEPVSYLTAEGGENEGPSSNSLVVRLDLLSSEMSLLNRYRRKSFQSANGKYRITLDSELEFYPVSARHNTFLHKSVDFVTIIVELKYDLEADETAKWITDHLPFRMTKSSKYVSGMERLYW